MYFPVHKVLSQITCMDLCSIAVTYAKSDAGVVTKRVAWPPEGHSPSMTLALSRLCDLCPQQQTLAP